jgi:hypothetical protein
MLKNMGSQVFWSLKFWLFSYHTVTKLFKQTNILNIRLVFRAISQIQWRLVAKISGGAAPENCIFFINWMMATDIKLKDYILYRYKERIKEKRTHIICYR